MPSLRGETFLVRANVVFDITFPIRSDYRGCLCECASDNYTYRTTHRGPVLKAVGLSPPFYLTGYHSIQGFTVTPMDRMLVYYQSRGLGSR